MAETSGNATCVIPDPLVAAVAFSVNEPAPAGLYQSVLADELQYWSPAPLFSVGATFETVGTVSGLTVNCAVMLLGSPSCAVTVCRPVVTVDDVQSYESV